jgi:hypothetical protein
VNWQPVIEFFVSVGYGVLSSLIPIFNSEIYIVASQVGGFTDEVTTAVGCAVGQTIGKVASCSRSAMAAVLAWCNEYGGAASAPANRLVGFGPSSVPGRIDCWNCWVSAAGEFLSSSSLPVSAFRRCTR